MKSKILLIAVLATTTLLISCSTGIDVASVQKGQYLGKAKECPADKALEEFMNHPKPEFPTKTETGYNEILYETDTEIYWGYLRLNDRPPFNRIVKDLYKTNKAQFRRLKEQTKGSSEQKYLIKNNGVDLFLIGQNIPTQADGYSITKKNETREEEGEEFKILVYTVSENGQEMLSIEKYAQKAGTYSDRIDDIFLLSDKYKTAKNIGLHSTIEEFTAAYPDFTIWFSYISGWYVIETEQLEGIQFFLDGNDFIEEGGPKFESDRMILKPSEFKKGSKITGIRIWG